MHILLITVGTTGDILPFIAIGIELKARGHKITIATHEDYQDLIEGHELYFRLIGGSLKQLVESKEGKAWIDSGDNMLKYFITLQRMIRPLFNRWEKDLHNATLDCDAVLLHPFAAYAYNTAEWRKIPVMVISLIPWFSSREIEPVLMPISPPFLKGFFNKRIQNISISFLWFLVKSTYKKQRKKLGLKPLFKKNIWIYMQHKLVPHLHLYSPLMLPNPSDLPDFAFITGFCYLDLAKNWQPPAELIDFCNKGKTPIYIGFGSMTGKEPGELAKIAIKAINQTKKRAIILTGWGGMKNLSNAENIYIANSIPHNWLFPKLKAVIHHGGLGTTAAGLHAGKPTGVIAFFGDQLFWGRRVYTMGLGPKPLNKKELNIKHLVKMIMELDSNKKYAVKAKAMGQALKTEQGAQQTADLIEEYLNKGFIVKEKK